MAAIDWPSDLCKVLRDGHTESFAPNVRRTDFADGAIAQRRQTTNSWMVRSFTIVVLQSNLAAFQTWLHENGHKDFNFRDWDGTTRDARLRGGAGGISLEAGSGLMEDERYYTGEAEVEGFF